MHSVSELKDLAERLRKRNQVECNEAADVIEEYASKLQNEANPSPAQPAVQRKPRAKKDLSA